MSTKQILIVRPNTVINVCSTITDEALVRALKINFPTMHGYIDFTPAQFKLWEAGKAVAQAEGLSNEQYIECFYGWVDAVENSGVEIEATKEFHELVDESIKDYVYWWMD